MNNQLFSNYDLIECPVSDEDDYRIEVLISLRRLERLDKDEYSDDERQEAEEVSTIILQCAKLSTAGWKLLCESNNREYLITLYFRDTLISRFCENL